MYISRFQALANMLATTRKVNVVFRGSGASTDGKTIFLPAFREVNAELYRDLVGYLDHEIAHIEETDFKFLDSVKESCPLFQFKMWNGFEDTWINPKIKKQYPGAEINLERLYEKLNAEIDANWSELPSQFRLIITLMDFMENPTVPRSIDADLLPLFTPEVFAEIAKLPDCGTTQDCWAAADRIFKFFQKMVEDDEKLKEALEQGKGPKQKYQADGSSVLSEGSDGEGSDGEGSDGEGSDGGEGGQKKGPGRGELGTDPADTLKKGMFSNAAWKELDSAVTDVHSYIEIEINEELEITVRREKPWAPLDVWTKIKSDTVHFKNPTGRNFDDSRKHVPYSTEEDKVIDYTTQPVDLWLERYQREHESIKNLVFRVQEEFRRMLVAKANARTIYELPEGKIATRNLARFQCNPNYKTPFKDNVSSVVDDVSIMCVVDQSGSMSGIPAATARQASMIFTTALSALGIEHEVVGFRTMHGIPGASRRYNNEDMDAFNRFDTLEHSIYKAKHSRTPYHIARISGNGANCDGESVRWAAQRLSLSRKKRKIMMVLSDGYPQCSCKSTEILNSDLRLAVREITRYGIETIGIGIMSDAVSYFYPKHLVLKKLADLPTAVMRELRVLLERT